MLYFISTFDHLIRKVFLTPEEEVVPGIGNGDPTPQSREKSSETKSKVPLPPVSATFYQVSLLYNLLEASKVTIGNKSCDL